MEERVFIKDLDTVSSITLTAGAGNEHYAKEKKSGESFI